MEIIRSKLKDFKQRPWGLLSLFIPIILSFCFVSKLLKMIVKGFPVM